MSTSLRQTGPDLDELVGDVERFAGDPATTSRVVAALGETAERLVASGFSAHRAPDGTPWAPLKRPRIGLGGPLLRTGDLRSEASRANYGPNGFVMRVDSPKAVHQRGFKRRNLPARPFYPSAQLPPTWEAVLETAADAALEVPRG